MSTGIAILWLVRISDGKLFPLPSEQYECISAKEADAHIVKRGPAAYWEAVKESDRIKAERARFAATAN